MKRISRPAGLPQSCAEMVRPSGVFTAIGLYFNSCPKLGPAAMASNEVATIALSRQQVCSDIVIGNPPTRSRLYLQVCPTLPITLLKRADELCIGQYVAL